MTDKRKPTEVEGIKSRSRGLRGTITEGLKDGVTGALANSDTQLTKFHGIYQQDLRDVRAERQRRKLEPEYSFMIRARVPGGVATPAQWLAFDSLAQSHANGSLRLTTRQAFQLHGVFKENLQPAIAGINAALMDTLAACGDVNRNVMCTANPVESTVHEEAARMASEVSAFLTPKTSAYHEIWIDGEKVVTTEGEAEPDAEPIYGPTYLPRKFKMGLVIPPDNDIDVYSQDLGFIAIVEDGNLAGFNVVVGGGMGMTHGELNTYPCLAQDLGYCTPDKLFEVSEAVVTTQRDFGNRTDRKRARMKYTIDERGIDWFRDAVEKRLGWTFEAPKPVEFTTSGDRPGWVQGYDGRWHLTLVIPAGRIADTPAQKLMTALRELAGMHTGDFRLTANQNLVVANVEEGDREKIEALLGKYDALPSKAPSELRLRALACVALPTCGLAMAEAERYLPDLVGKIESLLARHGLSDEPITLRITGCPNGCARPYLAEIGLVGKAPGRYNLYLGAGFAGERLNRLYRENVDETEILDSLDPLFGAYATKRNDDEHFGDFLIRDGVIAPVKNGRDFHSESGPPA